MNVLNLDMFTDGQLHHMRATIDAEITQRQIAVHEMPDLTDYEYQLLAEGRKIDVIKTYYDRYKSYDREPNRYSLTQVKRKVDGAYEKVRAVRNVSMTSLLNPVQEG